MLTCLLQPHQQAGAHSKFECVDVLWSCKGKGEVARSMHDTESQGHPELWALPCTLQGHWCAAIRTAWGACLLCMCYGGVAVRFCVHGTPTCNGDARWPEDTAHRLQPVAACTHHDRKYTEPLYSGCMKRKLAQLLSGSRQSLSCGQQSMPGEKAALVCEAGSDSCSAAAFTG